MRFAELLATPGVHEESVLRSTFGFMAFHGGNLERVTDDIARVAAERSGASYYAVIQEYPLREHLPSIEVSTRSSPLLAAFVAHVEVVIAVHGYGRDGLWTSILAGGTNRSLASVVTQAFNAALPGYITIDDLEAIPKELRGLHPQNPVNLPRLGGVQIELPPRIRGLTPQAARMERIDGRIAPTNDLINALVHAVTVWQSGLGTSLVESGLGTSSLVESGLGTTLVESGLGTASVESGQSLSTDTHPSPSR